MERLRIHDEIEDENCGEIKYQKLGKALHYGLTKELTEYVKRNGTSLYHFYGCLSCLCLYGCLSNQIAAKAVMEIHLGIGREGEINAVVEKLSKLIFNELREKFVFNTFEELETQLNLFRIPKWCFYVGTQLMKYYAKSSCLCDDILYYISSEESDFGSALIGIEVEQIRPDTNLEDEDEVKDTILNGFNEMLGFDTKMHRIYLALKGQESKYGYYDILDNDLVICDNSFFALEDGNLFVLTEDNYIARKMGDSIHKLKEFDYSARYELRKEYFFVYPDENSSGFFYPYYLYFDGKVLKADKYEAKKILWRRISYGVYESTDYALLKYKAKMNNYMLPMPEEFSINCIRDSMVNYIPSGEQCKMKGYVLVDNLLKIIANYINKDKDITNLLYALCEGNYKICKLERRFPSEELYWRLKEIAVENINTDKSLDKLMTADDHEGLIKEIIKEVKVKEEPERKKQNECKIGFLIDSKSGINALSSGTENGLFVGNYILPVGDYSKYMGIVIYDADEDIIYVTTNRVLSGEERLYVSKEFECSGQPCIYIIQPKIGDRRTMEVGHGC